MREVELKIKVEVSDDAEWLTVDESGEPFEHRVDAPSQQSAVGGDGWYSYHRDMNPTTVTNWRDLKINLKEYFEKQNPFRIGDVVIASHVRANRGMPAVVEDTRDCTIKLYGQWCPSEEWKHYEKSEKPEPVIKKGELVNHVMTALPVFLKQTYEGSIARVVATVTEEYLTALEKKIDASR